MAPNEALSLTQFSDRLRQAAVQDVQCEEPGEVFSPRVPSRFSRMRKREVYGPPSAESRGPRWLYGTRNEWMAAILVTDIAKEAKTRKPTSL